MKLEEEEKQTGFAVAISFINFFGNISENGQILDLRIHVHNLLRV